MLAVWVEIPVKNLERAATFYQALFQEPPVEIVDDGTRRTITLFGGSADGKSGISLNQTANFEPCDKGVLVYLDTGDDLTEHLSRVEPSGGKIVAGKASMGPAGWLATFIDSEGNLLALYSVN
ncbi:MAG: VOC family protein [Burkholderiales bacterium]|nr:VOC family protein [Anaerolineae bacterium]